MHFLFLGIIPLKYTKVYQMWLNDVLNDVFCLSVFLASLRE